jgi:UDP-N-acetylmuramate dehydrogenase
MSGAEAAVADGLSWAAPFAGRMRRDVAIGPMTTIRIGGVARFLLEPRDAEDAAAALRAARQAAIPTRVLGGGSNLLVADAPFEGLVLHAARMNHVEICGTSVTAGAGASLSSLIAVTTNTALGGLEVLAGIPGHVGGAIAMNSGGRFGEIGPRVERVQLATPDGRIETASGADLRFSYRRAEIPPGCMVVSVTLALAPGDRRELKRRAGAILKEKNAAQPTTAWNFGCMFKNPPCGSAGKLVEACGLKGATRGGARISPLHGNFVENLGSATAREVLDLIEIAEDSVRERHGVVLEREVRVWS